jgi:undecaprenyl-phosphate galactose phosphotransferase/putative colanic acid biosynthesis UDP-glucose lipid carrier transferase
VQTICLLSNLFCFLLFYKDAYRIIRVERIENILIRNDKTHPHSYRMIAVFVSLLKYSEVSRFRLFLYYFFCVAFFISDSFHETHEIHPGARL